MPDGVAVGIGDFRIIYDTRNAVRMFNVSAAYRSYTAPSSVVSPLLPAARYRAASKVYFGENIAENTVVLHVVGIGVHGVGIFVVGNTCRICGVGLICIAAAKGDSNDALAGVDEGTAAVGRGNVGVIVCVAQPNRLAV